MYCKYCGNKIDDDAVFCRTCGKKVEIFPESVSPELKQQEIAKQDVKEEAKCDYSAAANEKRKNKKGIIIALIASIAIVLAGVSIIIISSRNNQTEPDKQEAQIVPETTIAQAKETETSVAQINETAPAATEINTNVSVDDMLGDWFVPGCRVELHISKNGDEYPIVVYTHAGAGYSVEFNMTGSVSEGKLIYKDGIEKTTLSNEPYITEGVAGKNQKGYFAIVPEDKYRDYKDMSVFAKAWENEENIETRQPEGDFIVWYQEDAEDDTQAGVKKAVKIKCSDKVRDDNEYCVYTYYGLDENDQVLWEMQLDPVFLATEVDRQAVIGIDHEYGYIYNNELIKINLADGSVVWSVNACSGSPSWAFDSEGNLYIIGFYEQCLKKVDPQGNVTESATIGDYYWPMGVVVSGDKVAVSCENGTVDFNKDTLSLAKYNGNKVHFSDPTEQFVTYLQGLELVEYVRNAEEKIGMDIYIGLNTSLYDSGEATIRQKYDLGIERNTLSTDVYFVIVDKKDKMIYHKAYGRQCEKESELGQAVSEFINTINASGDYYAATKQCVDSIVRIWNR